MSWMDSPTAKAPGGSGALQAWQARGGSAAGIRSSGDRSPVLQRKSLAPARKGPGSDPGSLLRGAALPRPGGLPSEAGHRPTPGGVAPGDHGGGRHGGTPIRLFQAMIDEGDEVVFPVPTYPIYRLAASAAGASASPGPCERISPPWIWRDWWPFAGMHQGPGAVQPQQSTGSSCLGRICCSSPSAGRAAGPPRDEAYAEYVHDPRYVSGVDLFRQRGGNIVILRTSRRSTVWRGSGWATPSLPNRWWRPSPRSGGSSG